MTEAQIHKAILSWLRTVLPRALIHHSPNEVSLSGPDVARAIAKAKAAGMVVGFPDFLVVAGGVAVGLEVKRPGNYATPAQKAVVELIEANGGHWFVVRSIADAREALRDAGVATNEAMGC